ncbi:OsmC family protein [Halobellus rufus]|uniref:OsmC family protein n=1 Tax=Halobellus rufus TaxID=1448860 RepID=UPI0006786AD1|nr:OsmC family protein [Halobellus rufus]
MAGEDEHPAPVDFLLLSLASCQASVLNQCLEKKDVEIYRIVCEAVIDEYSRTDEMPEEMPSNTGLRIDHITVKMVLHTTPRYQEKAERCLSVYDEGCIVGKSLNGGIDYTPLVALEVTEDPHET